jgi:threonine synthase
MKWISTRNQGIFTNFHDAVFQGLAPDGGLYVPSHFPTLKQPVDLSLTPLGVAILNAYIPDIPTTDLERMVTLALNFPIPLVHLENNIYLLELFHGPTLAFKDVGARFMANLFSYFLLQENKHLTVMVATSGDTGSAIASAFHHMPNIDVYILYPSKKVTFLQEQQMTTLGGNVHALEVEGTFDDCQRLVKEALLDATLREKRLITTANSINISRLLPQIIYHAHGLGQLQKMGIHEAPILSIPSGNFGNIVSAIYAASLGFPIQQFIAATNINAIVPYYLETGKFVPKPSLQTFSNAMDVGNPSNFERLISFYGNDLEKIRSHIKGVSISDKQTLTEIRETYERTGYILDPHTAVGVAASRKTHDQPVIVTATAHPAKFPEAIQQAIGVLPIMPERLKMALEGQKQAHKIEATYASLKRLVMGLLSE